MANVENTENTFLRKLDAGIRHGVLSQCERVHIEPLQVLHTKDEEEKFVYFPEDALLSLVIQMPDERSIEVVTVGKEGVMGLPVLWGADILPAVSIGEVPGYALKVAAEPFRRIIEEHPALNHALQLYCQALFVLVGQGLACNSLHSLEERCARWILMAYDRVSKNKIVLTQEILAQMLAVRRPAVTLAAGALKRAGLIEYSRGVLTILDHNALEAAACGCYGIMKKAVNKLGSE